MAAAATAVMAAAVPTTAAEEGSQLSKFRKLSLALCSEQTPRAARRIARRWRLGAMPAAASRSSVGSGSLTSTGRDGQPVRKLVLYYSAVHCTATQPLLPSLAFSLFQLLLFGTKINTPLSGAPNFYSIAFHTPTNVRSSGAG